jgi:aspartate carbamoyltransferase catalytic subunit
MVRDVVAIAPPTRRDISAASRHPTLAYRDPGDFSELDAIVMIGLPPRRGVDELDAAARRPYALTGAQLQSVDADSRIFSPMPMIDELDDAVRADSRLRMWEQSDSSVGVRAEILSVVVDRLG